MVKYEFTKGLYTIIVLDRRVDPTTISRTRLSETIGVGEGESLVGELVSVVCHRGDSFQNGHYISYHKTDDAVWYMNDDDNKIQQSSHPFKTKNNRTETCDILFYKNYVAKIL